MSICSPYADTSNYFFILLGIFLYYVSIGQIAWWDFARPFYDMKSVLFSNFIPQSEA